MKCWSYDECDSGIDVSVSGCQEERSQTSQFIADELAGLIKSRFNPTLADRLMDEAEREPEWLVDMMKKPQVGGRGIKKICRAEMIRCEAVLVPHFFC